MKMTKCVKPKKKSAGSKRREGRPRRKGELGEKEKGQNEVQAITVRMMTTHEYVVIHRTNHVGIDATIGREVRSHVLAIHVHPLLATHGLNSDDGLTVLQDDVPEVHHHDTALP